MKRLLTTVAVSAFLAFSLQGGCTEGQVNSAGTIANSLAQLTYQNAQLFQQYRLDSHKITQAQYDDWLARAHLLMNSAQLATMTAQQLRVALDQLQTPAP